MNRILVLITLPTESIEKIRATPDLQQKEMQYIKQWQNDEILESFFITVSKTGAALIFKNVNVAQSKELIGTLPYFPYMSKVDYFDLDKQF